MTMKGKMRHFEGQLTDNFRKCFEKYLEIYFKDILENILRIIGGYLTMTMSGTIWDLALLISENRKVKTHGTGR